MTSTIVTVDQLFKAASLQMQGPVPWQSPIEEKAPGVYVITLVQLTEPSLDNLPSTEISRWNAGQRVIYIGRAKQIRRRINQFYKHKYGEPRPHRGGQAILLLNCPLQVYWAISAAHEASEEVMIEEFRCSVGRMPFANRVRSAQPAFE